MMSNLSNSSRTAAVYGIIENNVHKNEIERISALPDQVRFILLNQDIAISFNAFINVLKSKLDVTDQYQRLWTNVVYNMCIVFKRDNFLNIFATEFNPVIIEFMKQNEIKDVLQIFPDIAHQNALKTMNDMKNQLNNNCSDRDLQEICKLFLKQESLYGRFFNLYKNCTETFPDDVSSPIKDSPKIGNSPIKNSPKSVFSFKGKQRKPRSTSLDFSNRFEVLNALLESDVPNEIN